jgi:hypothetical protein
MKKLLALSAIILLLFLLYGTLQRITPSYFIRISDTDYSFDEFFQQSVTMDAYEALDRQQKLVKIYEQLKVFLCKPDCNITVFSFDKVPVDPEVEGVFYRDQETLTNQVIQSGRIALAQEQYFFSILNRTLILINDETLKFKVEGSVFPWIGKTQDGLLIEFMYATNFNEWFRPWMIRFIRDYRSFVKIHIFPYEEGFDFMQQLNTAVCLKEKKAFWDLYLSDKLNLKEVACIPSAEVPAIEKHDLAIRLGPWLYTSPKSYGELAKNFQISYLSLKVR